MPNSNYPSGLGPVRYMNGAPWNGAINPYWINPTDTNAIWPGDLVTTIGSTGGDAYGIPSCTLATPGAAARGVCIAIGVIPFGSAYYDPDSLRTIYRPLGAQAKGYYAAVVDDPNVLFEVQEGGGGAVLTTAAVNRNVNIAIGTRNATPVPSVSPMFLNNATVAGTATLNLKIIQAITRADNTIGQQYQKWLCLINNHELRAGTASS